MIKKTVMTAQIQLNISIVALVALVAIVGLVSLVLNAASAGGLAPAIEQAARIN